MPIHTAVRDGLRDDRSYPAIFVAASDAQQRQKILADFVADAASDTQLQRALDTLPSTGGKITLSEGTFPLAATLARAIDNVTIVGAGKATLITVNDGDAVISAGSQVGWLIRDINTDAGGLNLSGATDSYYECWIHEVFTRSKVQFGDKNYIDYLDANDRFRVVANDAAIAWFDPLEAWFGNKLRLQEITTPGTPPSDSAYFFAKQVSGVDHPHWKDEAGTETDLFDAEASNGVITGDLAHSGPKAGFFSTPAVVQPDAYTPSNVTPDRSFNADSTSVDEVADVLGTLIADLKAYGLLK
jgi:hypothetical protein